MKIKLTLFEMGWYLLLIKNYLTISKLITLSDFIDDLFSFAILGCILLSILQKKYNKKHFIIAFIVGLLALYTGYNTRLMIITTTVLSILGIYCEDKRKIMKRTLFLSTIFLIINTFGSLVVAGVSGQVNILYYFIEEGRIRISLGYGMAGHLADCIFNIMILYVYIKNNKLTYFDELIMFIGTIVTFLITNSRLILCLSMLFMLLTKYVRKKKKSDILRWIAALIAPICTFTMILTIRMYEIGSVFAKWFDDAVMNSRVRMCGYNWEKFGSTLLGQFCDLDSNTISLKWMSKGNTFDNGYIFLIVNMGIIWLAFICIINIFVEKKDNLLISVYVIVFSLGLMIDADFLNSARLVLVLIICDYAMTLIEEKSESDFGISMTTKA